MNGFSEHLAAIKPQIDARIREVASRKLKDDYLVELLARGKRLRAGLLLLTFESNCSRKPNGALDLACAIELAHSASLIIDDMLDEDDLRRGMPTVHITEGHKRAMLDTVGILSLPYDLVVPHGQKYVQELAATQRGMVTGVLKELVHRPELPASKIYDIIIKQKTGEPFGLAASWGYLAAMNGRRSARQHQRLWRAYGTHVGKAMQIADDIVDLEEAVLTGRRTGYGSEFLLLRCVTAERLAKELLADIRKLDLHLARAREKTRELWSSEGVQASLAARLDVEIDAAVDVVKAIGLHDSRHEAMLMRLPREIADIMLVEKRATPLTTGSLIAPAVMTNRLPQ